MSPKLVLLSFILILSGTAVLGQEKSKAKFGNVSPADFEPKAYAIDSSAHAIVLAHVGSTEIEGNSKGGFSLLFKNYRRARILHKNGYDIAEVSIQLYSSTNGEEELQNLKAVTYNLENGKVVETKLDVKSSLFKDKLNKNNVVRKFTFPNIKEGSIIEFEYKITSDFIFNLQPWDFQGQYPRLWSEYNVAMPEFYNYVTLSQGYHPFALKDQKVRSDNFSLSESRSAGASERATFSANVTDYRWVMKDVPALKAEYYTSTLGNHISRIEFQLASIGHPFQPEVLMGSWAGASKRLLEREDFGEQLVKENGWLADAVTEAGGKVADPVARAKNIFLWVRDNFTCTDHSAMYLSQNLKNILKTKNGNVADINLLLVAMLRKADLTADPVVLSTRSNGYTHSIYPLLHQFNYVIARAELGDKEYYLDATEPQMGFGKLDYECYNGHSRIINKDGTPVELNSDKLMESSFTSVFIVTDEKGNSIGTLQQAPGYYESYKLRKQVKKEGKTEIEKNVSKLMGSEITINKFTLDSLHKFEEPVYLAADFGFEWNNSDIIYFNPMMGEGYKENPFKAAQRFYPVEMPYKIDQTVNLQMEVPKGYEVDELPKQTMVKFNDEGDATFEYRISLQGNNILFRSKLSIKKTWFAPEDYEILREFFNLVVTKHSEQIVFKKKK